ncbi:aldo/keto reductase [Aquimarina sp. MMG015]|uniref:aldo/keto reductase n=1 Tax=unclassified Aquimarina TaxID=2627091 RepID=UPI000D555C4F|nr:MULTISPECIES: aldo/keto reductase [unclassified Aquimarina]AXT55564.1 aldo/keto reductase [Aquimarina sp. AD1]MBQ4804332.1 aldo/keto reductase [Aquimarina sp. MMG015]RKN22968.1 aldo/keto reductase [Aquimarina sp. AD1]
MNIKISEKGPLFSRIVAGCMNWGEWGANLTTDESQKLIEDCLEIGVTTFDHADIYGHYTTESLFGNAIKGKSSLREQMQLVTKCGIRLITPNRPDNQIKSYKTTKKYIIESVEQSLVNLQTDFIDMLLIHRPSPLMNPLEIAEAFETLKSSGKVLHFGVSNFTPSQFDMLNDVFPLQTNQIEISPLRLTPFIDGSLDQCIKHAIKPMAYSTLAGGKFFSKQPNEKVVRINEVINPLIQKYEVPADQILTAWLLKHPSGILPIMGSTKITRIQSAVNSLSIEITDEEWFRVWEASTGTEVA